MTRTRLPNPLITVNRTLDDRWLCCSACPGRPHVAGTPSSAHSPGPSSGASPRFARWRAVAKFARELVRISTRSFRSNPSRVGRRSSVARAGGWAPCSPPMKWSMNPVAGRVRAFVEAPRPRHYGARGRFGPSISLGDDLEGRAAPTRSRQHNREVLLEPATTGRRSPSLKENV